MSYYIYPKSKLANFDQIYNNYTTSHMHYQHIFYSRFNKNKFNIVNIIIFLYKFG